MNKKLITAAGVASIWTLTALIWLLVPMGGGLTDNASCSISHDGPLVCAFPDASGSKIVACDIKSGAHLREFEVIGLDVLGVYSVDHKWFYEARQFTPSNDQTIQVLIQDENGSSPPTPLLPPDETMRTGLVIIAGSPVYLKSSTYVGAFGGRPWSPPFEICTFAGGVEKDIAPAEAATDGIASGSQPLYPYAQWASGKETTVVLQDVGSGSSKRVLIESSPDSLAVSPDRRKLAWIAGITPTTVNVMDLTSGRVVSTSVAGRVTQVLFDSAGNLYLVRQDERGSPVMILKVDGDETVPLFSVHG